MSDPAPSKSGSGTLTALAVLGGFLIFVIILLIVYVPKRSTSTDDGVDTAAKRATTLSDLRNHDATVASSYAWADKAKGVVQLPIDRAMELTLDDIKAKQPEQK